VTQYLCDKDGKLEFAITSDQGVSTLRRWNGTAWLKCPVDLDTVEIVGAGNRAGDLVVVGPRREGNSSALRLSDATTGQLGTVLLEDAECDFDGWLYRDPKTREVVGACYQRNGPRVTCFDEGADRRAAPAGATK
jgi:hypothetical protein